LNVIKQTAFAQKNYFLKKNTIARL